MLRFQEQPELKLFDCSYKIEKETKEKWTRGRHRADTKPVLSELYRIKVTEIL